jgi:crossover junction endodeoxyribonuclease RuvC
MNYIGIDPGKKGGFAIISEDAVYCRSWDDADFIRYMKSVEGSSCVVCLEHVGAMPNQGVTSMFNFGAGFGFIQGVLSAYHIPFELVRPQKWKKEFSISDKNESIAVCQRLFPNLSLLPTERSRVPSDGMAEALLMAEYARRKL